MMKAPLVTLQQIVVRLDAQVLETAALRAALATQFTRIAEMQAELDVQRHARDRAQSLPAFEIHKSSHSGNGHRHG